MTKTNQKTTGLMRILSDVANHNGVGNHIYVVGGAVRNHLLGVPVKDIDVVVDSVALEGKDSDWFAKKVAKAIPVNSNVTTNQYGVAIITVCGDWTLDGAQMSGEVIEIANARKESYGGSGKGKGYKPTDVQPATIEEDVYRREFTVNTLLWRLGDLTNGPDGAEVIDITGLGLRHLSEKVIQTPLDPDRTFSDDPTRMLRAIKFLVKYGLQISPEVETSIRKNAEKLQNMPWEAVSTILVQNILSGTGAREALVTMKPFGLIEVLAKMIATQRPFASFMAGQFQTTSHDVLLLLDMADLGLGSQSLGFLTTSQQASLRQIASSMTLAERTAFTALLRRPQVDNEGLISEFKLSGRDRQEPVRLAREALLQDPSLFYRPNEVENFIRVGLSSR